MNPFEKYAVSLEALSLRFGSHSALSDITLNINKGAFISIVGPNGGGKSSLIKVLLGLIKPTSGNAYIFGKKPDEIETHKIGYVPQIKTLDRSFPALPLELVLTGLTGTWTGRISSKMKKLALEGLEKVGASHLACRPLSKLSGGEMQRIYLARSLVRKPELLLLDEPSTGIDSVAEKDINKLLDEYKKESNSTVIMVTHDWEAAYHHSDGVIMLNCGLVDFAPPRDAFNDDNLRMTFGHMGHAHEMNFGGGHND